MRQSLLIATMKRRILECFVDVDRITDYAMVSEDRQAFVVTCADGTRYEVKVEKLSA